MTQPNPIILDVDASRAVAGFGAGQQAGEDFASSLRTVPIALGPAQAALNGLTPSRATLAGLGALGTLAGSQQAQWAGVQAQAKLTGVSYGQLREQTRALARDLPLGNKGALEMTQTLTRLGVAGKGVPKPLQDTTRSLGDMHKTAKGGEGILKAYRQQWSALFGSKGEMTSPGTERRLGEIAKTYTKMGAALGEAPAQMAVGMTRLNQAFGSGNQAQRVERLSDSVTTLAAQTGAGASGLLEMSRSIAPYARAAGIGQTATMGISAAFVKMGEDGYGAASTVGKILNDVTRSAREGTPNLGAYAQMIGKTTDQVLELQKSNPVELLTQITEAMAQSPQNAPRMLEQVGLDGVRDLRRLQALAQQGQLRSTVSTAVGSYGSGATEMASQEAMDGLYDSATKAASASEQLANAMGTPLLGPLTLVTDMLGGLASAGEKVMGSGGAQGFMTAAAWAAGGLLLAKKLTGAGLIAAGGAQLATSSPARAAVAGIRVGYAGGAEGALTGRTGRYGAPIVGMASAGMPLSPNRVVAGISGGVYRAGQAVGGFFGGGGETRLPGQRGNGWMGATQDMGLRGRASLLGQVGLGGYMRFQSEQLRLARTPFAERSAVMRPQGNEFQRYSAQRQQINQALAGGHISESTAARQMRRVQQNLVRDFEASSRGVRGFTTQLVRGTAAIAGQGLATGGTALAAGALRGGRALAGVMGGPAGLALMGGFAGYQMRQSHERGVAADRDRRDQAGTFVDEYRIAMGKATEATSTFAGRLSQASEDMARSVTSMVDATRITEEDKRAASGIDKRVRTFAGTPTSAGRLMAAEHGTNPLTPDEVARISYDLIDQYGAEGAEKALQTYQRGVEQQQGTPGTGDLTAALTGQMQAPSKGFFGGGWKQTLRGAAQAVDFTRLWGEGSAGGMNPNIMTDEQKQGADSILAQVDQRAAGQSNQFGAKFAAQQTRDTMDALVNKAIDAGENQWVQELARGFQENYGGGAKSRDVSIKEIEKAGGFSNWYAQQNESFAGRFGEERGRDVAMTRQRGWVADQMGAGNPLTQFFDLSAKGGTNDKVRSMLDSPEDPGKQLAALQSLTQEARNSGMSLVDLANNAAKAAESHTNAADASHQLVMALQQAATQLMAVRAPFQTPGAATFDRASAAAGAARIRPNDAADAQLQKQGIADLIAMQEQAVESAKARLTAQREYQVQSGRMGQDYRQQQSWAEADYLRGRERQVADYNKTVARSQLQFQIQTGRQEADYYRNRRYALEDFARSMKRMAEDAAKEMYSPFERIQVQPTWDTANLAVNLASQLEAMQGQVANLAKARQSGLSDAVISMLGLNDTKNAQQLAVLVSDLVNDPQLAKTLNQNVSQRTGVAGELLKDPSNLGVKRQSEDFTRQMDRQSSEFSLMMDRATQDFARSMSQMATDQQTALSRAAQDRDTAVSRTAAQYKIATGRMHDDLMRADEVITGDLASLTEALNSAVSGQFVDFQGLTSNGMKDWLRVLAGYKEEWADLINDLGSSFTLTLSSRTGNAAPRAYTDVEPGKPGRPASQLEPAGSFTGAQEFGNLRTSSAGSNVTYDSSLHVTDKSTIVSGPVTVQANDVDEFMRSVEEKQARDNLTAPPQRRASGR